jgi:2-polyprenyl-6-methoxyphenol hydroxylase-like FAD-dependent oxidoreductase
MVRRNQRAVVVGGSVAGLLAAAVLSRCYDHVDVLEQDTISGSFEPRARVPQAHHVHLLLQRGKQIIEDLVPGFLAELENAGCIVADLSHDVKWFQAGRWKNRWPTGLTAHYCTRGLLEETIRRRVAKLSNVRLRQRVCVTQLKITSKGVAGVQASADGDNISLDADFTVDASGRGSHIGEWLRAGGFDEPARELIPTRLGYVSRMYRARADLNEKWRVLLVFPRLPGDRRLCVISPVEGGRWMVTLGGWFGAYPDVGEGAFNDFVRALPVRDAWNALATAEPLGPPNRYTMIGGQKRTINLAQPWPEGFVVLGDALCSFNPIYSQGMTVCAMEAEALSSELRGYQAGDCDIKAVQRKIVAAAEQSWNQAKAQELRFPELSPSLSLMDRARFWYFDRLVDASAYDRHVLKSMLEVNNLIAPPSALFQLSLLGAALRPRPRSAGLGIANAAT